MIRYIDAWMHSKDKEKNKVVTMRPCILASPLHFVDFAAKKY